MRKKEYGTKSKQIFGEVTKSIVSDFFSVLSAVWIVSRPLSVNLDKVRYRTRSVIII